MWLFFFQNLQRHMLSPSTPPVPELALEVIGESFEEGKADC